MVGNSSIRGDFEISYRFIDMAGTLGPNVTHRYPYKINSPYSNKTLKMASS
jgi:hypothetical protein